MDAQGEVLDKLFSTLTGDSTLENLFGGTVKLYPIDANKDPTVPYMIHELSGSDKDLLRVDGTYYLDIYTEGNLKDKAWPINEQVKVILTENRWSTGKVKFRTGTIDRFESIQTETKEMNHYVGQWPLTYYKHELVDKILTR